MKKTALFLMGMGLACVAEARAGQAEQDSLLNRTVVVENQYNPEAMDAFKINVLPKVEEPAVTKQHIDYATTAHPVTAWNFVPMAPMAGTQEQDAAPRGYFRAAYGNRNNTDVKASYLWDISTRDRLDVMTSFYGMNGKVPAWDADAPNWQSRFFRTDASLGYHHDFRKLSLSLGGAFASQTFNYMPEEAIPASETEVIGHQRYTLYEGYAGVASSRGLYPVDFTVRVGMRGFKVEHALPVDFVKKETAVRTEGEVSGAVGNGQRAGIGFAVDNLFYDTPMEDYTLLQVNPFYSFCGEAARLRIGAHVDWQTAHESGVKAAPDVRLDYTFAGTYTLFLHATGGVSLNDFRRINELSPYYGMDRQLETTYTSVDAQVGFKASPVPGLGFRLFGGYRITEDEVFILPENYTSLLQAKAKVGYGGADVNYTCKDRFDFSLQGVYYGWNMDKENETLLYLKPQFTLDATVRARIVKGVHASVAYSHEARQKIADLERAEAVSNLKLSVEYQPLCRLNIFACAENLLNRTYLMSYGYPAQGCSVLAGLSYRF